MVVWELGTKNFFIFIIMGRAVKLQPLSGHGGEWECDWEFKSESSPSYGGKWSWDPRKRTITHGGDWVWEFKTNILMRHGGVRQKYRLPTSMDQQTLKSIMFDATWLELWTQSLITFQLQKS